MTAPTMKISIDLPLLLHVHHREMVATDIVRLDFLATHADALPAVEAGSNIALEVDGGIRSYSLANTRNAIPGWSIYVQRSFAPLSRSHFVHDHIRVGDKVTALEVASDFKVIDGAPHHVLIGGGIGITPFFSMVEHFRATGQSWELHYVTREEARRIPLPTDWEPKVRHYAGRHGPRGLHLEKLLAATKASSHIYVCGPVDMIDDVRRIGHQVGLLPTHIHSESFGQRSSKLDGPIRIRLRQSDMEVDVAPGITILDAMLDAGVWAPFECRRGVCGSCLTEVVAGAPLHRDSLDASLRGSAMCICVSWASSEVLELDL